MQNLVSELQANFSTIVGTHSIGNETWVGFPNDKYYRANIEKIKAIVKKHGYSSKYDGWANSITFKTLKSK